MQQVVILGATGSIGSSTLSVIAQHPDKYSVLAVSANTDVEKLKDICKRVSPQVAILSGLKPCSNLTAEFEALKTQLLFGEQALCDMAAHPNCDVVMAAIVGAAGLPSSLAAANAGKKVLLANKESLVIAGELFLNAVIENNAQLLPIDSEHNAIFQCLPQNFKRSHLAESGIRKVLLTGSGGPFRNVPLDELEQKTPEQAVAHPNWTMGKKISVDSATMMNKGLELIEACHLFGLKAKDVEVVIHPQSVIHSMVSYIDGSVIAQMGQPDMRTPIGYGLAWPERIETGVEPLDFFAVSQLDFEQPDLNRYPCLGLAYRAFELGGTAPAALNAANEISVAAFLQNRIKFTDIAKVNQFVLEEVVVQAVESLEQLLMVDQTARKMASKYIETMVI